MTALARARDTLWPLTAGPRLSYAEQRALRLLLDQTGDGGADAPLVGSEDASSGVLARPAAVALNCPTCGSHSPNLHPALQHEGEVVMCGDDWHKSL